MQAEFDLPDGVDSPVLFVHGMIGALIGQVIGVVHFLLGQGFLGWILDQKGPFVIGLHQCFAGKGIGIAGLDGKAFCISTFVRQQLRVCG